MANKMKHIQTLILAALAGGLASCNGVPKEASHIDMLAPIFPDYNGVTIPCNMARPTFDMSEEAALSYCKFKIVEDKSDYETLRYLVYGKRKDNGHWDLFNPVEIKVSPDSIDPYIAYRRIDPGFRIWNKMGIYQRDLSSYEEFSILTNDQTDEGCMNCHSFHQYSPKLMMFHLRAEHPGTYVLKDGVVNKISAVPANASAKLSKYKSLVYPSWHPTGRFIAFSVNDTQQSFHSTNLNRIEVFDHSSDVVVYDTETDALLLSPLLMSGDQFETFPSFSPDGKSIYFCSADSVPVPDRYEDVHYSLCRIEFDPENKTFGNEVDTLYNARNEGGSVSFPRVSPDGRWLMFTKSSYGNFSIWHKDADLYMIDLTKDNTPVCLSDINSDDVDSYHSWNSNGRWIVFSSRRDDGLYTRPYFSHVDQDGKFTKPFMLPQKDAQYYYRMMQSYNIPEFISGKVDLPYFIE
ncbi:MAG: hypothetical protein MJZ41_14645 [Bacteroidaceae bacterium]|nr:hypothetical protein [Bacteroidaceae bacterium]